MFLPEKIRGLVRDEPFQKDGIGMSGSTVLMFHDKVLKIQQCSEEAENEYRMMKYLQGRVPVPEVYACETEENRMYLLMRKCTGRMACSGAYRKDWNALCGLLANSLKTLWSVDVSDCPCDQRLCRKLAQAARNVEAGLVDLDNVEPDTFGEGGFRDPEDLLQWLYDHMPEEEPVLSHGDLCLPNVFGIEERVTGYIDLGRAGTADKWCDIALCCRSLFHNFNGKYSDGSAGRMSVDFDVRQFFSLLGLEPDWQKIRYYILLDELF